MKQCVSSISAGGGPDETEDDRFEGGVPPASRLKRGQLSLEDAAKHRSDGGRKMQAQLVEGRLRRLGRVTSCRVPPHATLGGVPCARPGSRRFRMGGLIGCLTHLQQ